MGPVPFDNSYGRLPERFYSRLPASPVSQPELLFLNKALACDLQLDLDWLHSKDGVKMLAGNGVPEGADPLAQVYAGHQFGGWVPQLGDGRALLLGEVIDINGLRRDIQLKGSGRTPYSRQGDGRAWLGPVLREYIVSEAMAALGIPTTRALAAVATGETVFREGPLPGAVLTRVAASHIRVGTFQYFAARNDTEALELLVQHVIARHYGDADGPLGLLKAVISAQANLVAKWLGVGFIHGVMNTDNTAISGETIDYGPCAFMDAYDPAKVFSSIDHMGRYAYGRQAQILGWNLAQFASALIPLIDDDTEAAIAAAQEVMDGYIPQFSNAYLDTFRAKLGLTTIQDGDGALIDELLRLMAESSADFTNTFRALGSKAAADQFTDRAAFSRWKSTWLERVEADGSDEPLRSRITQANPAVIPRNHRIEQAIDAAVAGDLGPANRLITTLQTPFADLPQNAADLAAPPLASEEVLQTFCGT